MDFISNEVLLECWQSSGATDNVALYIPAFPVVESFLNSLPDEQGDAAITELFEGKN